MSRAMTVLVLCIIAAASAAADVYVGRSVAAVIDEMRASGFPFAYSTRLVPEDLKVLSEPDSDDPLEIVLEVLKPHGLTLYSQDGVHLVIKANHDELQSGSILLRIRGTDGAAGVAALEFDAVPDLPKPEALPGNTWQFADVRPGRYTLTIRATGFQQETRVFRLGSGDNDVIDVKLSPARPEIETVTISASRYEISRDIAASRFLLDQRSIQDMPDVGDDPIRIAQRLPGAAASGASARTHFRGGDDTEIGVMLNGQWLFDPYHIRDYQSVFSAIDGRAISGVEVYTGGFPARYGDRMSGLVLMESMRADEARNSEIGISVFNTSFLTSGSAENRSWLFSARRGNLDLVIDPKFGEPSYYDVFGELTFDLTPDVSVSLNALYANDQVRLVLESDPDEFEQVVSKTRNIQLWAQIANQWTDSLSSSTVLAALSYDNLRIGSTDDVEKIVSAVSDDRDIEQVSLRQDWTWTPSDMHLLQWGIQTAFSDAVYDYSGRADFFGLQSRYQNRPDSISRTLAAAPSGGSFAVYVSDRWRLTRKTLFEWGMRWDDQSYTQIASDAQISPRFNVLYALTPKTELRLTAGRYHQSQAIQQLQIEDGITQYWPAQRSDHVIAGVRHLFPGNWALRFEAFHKNMSRVMPRFENLYDPLGLIPELQPDRVRVEPSNARATGIEVSIDRSAREWSWWASYSLSRVTDRIDGRNVRRSWDQRHALQAGLAWSGQHWSAAVAGSIHSGWPSTGLTLVDAGVDMQTGEPEYTVIPGPRNAEAHPTFSTIDMRLSRSFDVRRGSLLAFIEVSNVLNRRNACCLDWDTQFDANNSPVLERGVDYWLPLLPAVGVLWEF